MYVGVTEFLGGVQCCVETREHSAARHCTEFPLICHGGRRSRGVLVGVCDQSAIWINRVASKIVFQPLVPDTGAPLHEKFVFAVRQEFNVHFEFYLRNVTGGMRTLWKLLVLVSQSAQEAVRWREAREHNAPSLIVLGPLMVTEDVGHETLC